MHCIAPILLIVLTSSSAHSVSFQGLVGLAARRRTRALALVLPHTTHSTDHT